MLHRGDSIDCELELVILPRRKSEYYGPSQYLQQTDAALFDTWEMVHRQCLNGSYKIMCAQGRHSKESIYPIAIETAEQDGVYAVFSLTGGLSYLPVVFTGIRENVCFLLQERINEEWVVSSDNTARQVLQDANGFRVLMNLYRDGKGDTTYRLINPLQAEKDAGRNGQL